MFDRLLLFVFHGVQTLLHVLCSVCVFKLEGHKLWLRLPILLAFYPRRLEKWAEINMMK
jgi:hypothetical protein